MIRVHVAVPVRDEEAGLPGLLQSLACQAGCDAIELTVHLLFDGCRDGGLAFARHVFETGSLAGKASLVSRAGSPNAGRARRLAVEHALEGSEQEDDAILLTTDADTVPDADWVRNAVAALREVDVVAGYTARDRAAVLPARDALETYLEDLHCLRRQIDVIPYDPAPSHPWVGGANLGFRVNAYRQLDGFAPIASGEDKDIVDRARHLGLRVRHDRAMRVVTSSRMNGRAKGGLADALRFMADEVEEPRVEHPADAARQYARHAFARKVYAQRKGQCDWTRAEQALGATQELRPLAKEAPNADAFAMKAVPAHETTRDVALSEAAAILTTLNANQFRV
ncbi:glycosyltransferase [Rhodophyticola sp.]|uniref:glycosyltransferase n=1 Tax=Rhodophyticola sp. TaxID=2680032 RepID=UPI003D281B4C